MSHYTDNPNSVRVDFFKDTGKWYTTEAVIWTGEYLGNPKPGVYNLIHDAFKKSLLDHFKDTPGRLGEMTAICLEPYHEHSHPISLRNWNEKT